jgi:hypothetical protein
MYESGIAPGTGCDRTKIHHCYLYNNRDDGIECDSDNVKIHHNDVGLSGRQGISCTGTVGVHITEVDVHHNYVWRAGEVATNHGIYFFYVDDSKANDNVVYDCTDNHIWFTSCLRCEMNNNISIDSDISGLGMESNVDSEMNNNIIDNPATYGIYFFQNNTDCIADGNSIYNAKAGVTIGATGNTRNTVTNNSCSECDPDNITYYGVIEVYGGTQNDISNNKLYNGAATGINIGSSVTYSTIANNTIRSQTTRGIKISGDNNWVYGNKVDCGDDGIEIASSANATKVGLNDLTEATTPMDDQGTNTQFPSIIIPFVDGTTFLSVGGAAWGYEIDVNTDYAIAMGVLPSHVHQCVKIKIFASSIIAEADKMRLEIVGQGGGDNEAYNAEAIAIVDHPSESSNFGAGDLIYWLIDASDDADVDDFVGGDHIAIKVLHEAAGGDDCATDATFSCISIEYV